MFLRQLPVLAGLLLILLAPFAALPGLVVAADPACPPPAAATAGATPVTTTFPEASFPDDNTKLTVLAAASLTDAFDEIGDLIEERFPNVSITIDSAGSQTLVTQLNQGARGDVLATADTSTMQQAQDDELIGGDPVIFIKNRLVIVTPPDNPAEIEGIDNLAGEDVRLVIAGEEVPAGRYAREAICAWAGEDSDILSAIGDNVVSEEVDVRSVLTKVLLGEADAGIVYASDATASDLGGSPLNVIAFPADVPTAVAYPIAPIAGGNTQAAQAFISFVLSEDGQQILERYGFVPVAS